MYPSGPNCCYTQRVVSALGFRSSHMLCRKSMPPPIDNLAQLKWVQHLGRWNDSAKKRDDNGHLWRKNCMKEWLDR